MNFFPSFLICLLIIFLPSKKCQGIRECYQKKKKKRQALSPIPCKPCRKTDVWAKVPVYRELRADGGGGGAFNPNQDSFLPLADRFLPTERRKAQLIGLSTRSRRSSMHAHNGFGNSSPSLRGCGSWVCHLEKQPGPPRSTARDLNIRDQILTQ